MADSPRSMYFQHKLMSDGLRRAAAARSNIDKTRAIIHKQRIMNELKALGVSRWGMLKMETRYLPHFIHEDESIGAVIYGHNSDGSAMLIATDRRVIFLDRKPLFTTADELTYDIVAGVSYSQVGFRATVTLHTRINDYVMHTLNIKCAVQFREYVEKRCLEFLGEPARVVMA